MPLILWPKVWFSLSGAAKKKSTVPVSYYNDLTKAVEGKVTPATLQIDHVLHQDKTHLLYSLVFSLSSMSMVLCLVLEICHQVSLLLLMKCLSLREGHPHLLFLVRVSLHHLMHLLQRIMALFQ
ncbi:unnamed protein product [Camellia sinensis]